MYQPTNCPNINAVLSSLITLCPTITHLAIPWRDMPLVIAPSSLPYLGVLESPVHCVRDIVPGPPVHTYDQARGGCWWDNIAFTPFDAQPVAQRFCDFREARLILS